MSSLPSRGLVDRRSHHTVDETVARLSALIAAKGATVFALIDHSGEAARAGLAMRPTKLLIFGSPRAGTPLMLAAPRSAIDLPLKILVWEDTSGATWLTTNSPAYLQDRHELSAELTGPLGAAEVLAEEAAR